MSRKINISDLPRFDMTEFLENEEAIAAYMNAALEDGDPALLATALGDIARKGCKKCDCAPSRRMTKPSQDADPLAGER